MEYLYLIRGKVRSGAKRGKSLGFPTANILLHQKIPEGIYASIVTIKEKAYYAATFIGGAKTFDEKQTEMIKRHLALVFKHEIDPTELIMTTKVAKPIEQYKTFLFPIKIS